MNWLFWLFTVLVIGYAIHGFRRGMIRTAISMVFFVIVIGVTSWMSPHVGNFIREKTEWQNKLCDKYEDVIQGIAEKSELSAEEKEKEIIDSLPLPKSAKKQLYKNNSIEGYKRIGANGFTEYLSRYLAYGTINGIAFLIAYVLTMILLQLVLYVVDMLTELPVVGTVNRIGGLCLGMLQGILWVFVIMLVIALLGNTALGGFLIRTIRKNPILSFLYDINFLAGSLMHILRAVGI